MQINEIQRLLYFISNIPPPLSLSIHQFLLEESNPYRHVLRIPYSHPRAQEITTENSHNRRPRAKKAS